MSPITDPGCLFNYIRTILEGIAPFLLISYRWFITNLLAFYIWSNI